MQQGLESKSYNFLFLDIVGFSLPWISAAEQVKMVSLLNDLVLGSEIFKTEEKESMIIHSTGDGFFIGFGDSKEKPLNLAVIIQKRLAEINKKRKMKNRLQVRIGLHSGEVYKIRNVRGEDDVCGPGIILAQRVMDFGDGGHILASDKIAQDLRKLSSKYAKIMHPLDRYIAKHGEEIFLYNVYGDSFGNPTPPASKNVGSISSIISPLETHAKLEVIDAKSLLVKHNVSRRIKNIGKAPITSLFMYLDGQVKRSWEKVGLRATDAEHKSLEIPYIVQDTPFLKEFSVKPRKPIQPNEEFTINLEFYWERPRRYGDLFDRVPNSKTHISIDFKSPPMPQLKPAILAIHPGTGRITTISRSFTSNKTKDGSLRFRLETSKLPSGTILRFRW